MKLSPYKRALPVGLTHTETADLAIEHATQVKRMMDMQREYKDVQNHWREEIKNQEGVVKNLLGQVLDGVTIQPVECLDEVDEDNWILSTKRLDTGEVIASRDMTDEEIGQFKQEELELDAPADGANDGDEAGDERPEEAAA